MTDRLAAAGRPKPSNTEGKVGGNDRYVIQLPAWTPEAIAAINAEPGVEYRRLVDRYSAPVEILPSGIKFRERRSSFRIARLP
jgi:hypothetical protein